MKYVKPEFLRSYVRAHARGYAPVSVYTECVTLDEANSSDWIQSYSRRRRNGLPNGEPSGEPTIFSQFTEEHGKCITVGSAHAKRCLLNGKHSARIMCVPSGQCTLCENMFHAIRFQPGSWFRHSRSAKVRSIPEARNYSYVYFCRRCVNHGVDNVNH